MTKDEIHQRRNQYQKNIPDLHNGSYVRLWKKAINQRSLAAAVKAKCLDCCCWQAVEVKNCQVPACPLFEIRPYADHPKRRKGRPRGTASEAENLTE